MNKPVDTSKLIKKPISDWQKYIINSYYDSDEYKQEVVINGAEILYSKCGMFVYIYNESKNFLWLINEQGIYN